tara:strand:+ start:694 stop:1158 length:465 start_codon:yes stop_codon:yes gene_type:complete
MRDILIVLLAVLFTMMTIVLFEIKSMTQQFLTLIIVLLGFIVFYMAIDKVHIFKEADNEVNINNTNFTEEGEMEEALGEGEDLGEDLGLGIGVDPEQNLVEADVDEPVVQEIVEISNPPFVVQETIENLNFTVGDVNRHNFGIVNRKINATINN